MSIPKKEEDIAESIRKKLEEHKKQGTVKSYPSRNVYPQYKPIPKPKEARVAAREISQNMQSNPTFQAEEQDLSAALSKGQAQEPPPIEKPYNPSAISETPKRRKSRLVLIMLIVVILFIIALLIAYLVFFVYLPSERELNVSENIDKAVILRSGEALVNLGEETDLGSLKKVQLIFSGGGTDYLYNPEQISREYKILASDLGLENFDTVTSVRVDFIYNYEEPNGTVVYPPPINQSSNQTNQTSGRNFTGVVGGGGGNKKTSCKPDCTGKTCGDDGCGGTCAPGCSSQYNCVSGQCAIIEGLVSYWKFDGDSNDSVGGNHGTVNGSSLIGGVSGQAYSFDGVNDYIRVNNSDTLNFGNNSFSIGVWVRSPNSSDFPRIIEKYSGSGWSIYKSGTASIKLRTFLQVNQTNFAFTGDRDLYDNNWHHIIVVYDRENSRMLQYIDGNLSGNFSINMEGTASSSSDLFIGRANSSQYFFNGTIDEVKIWNRSLTSEDALREYENIKKNMPISYWSFEGGARDSIGINHGTVKGASLTRGILGQAYSFNGSHYIDFGNKTSLDFGPNNFTIGAWIKANSSTSMTILSRRESSGSYWHYRVYGTGNQLALLTNNGTVVSYHQSNLDERIRDGHWHYVAVVRDSGSKVSYYVDGSLLSSVSDEGHDTSNNQSVLMGMYNKTGGYPFNGTIDEVKVWNRSLTSEEILREYEGARKLGLIAYWKFDGDTKDSAGKSDGTIRGNPSLTQGILGQAYNFDGIDDYIEIPGSGIDLDYNFSVSAWAYLQKQTANYPGIFWKDDTLVLRYCLAEPGVVENFQGFVRTGGNFEPRAQFGPYAQDNQWYHLVMTYDSNAGQNNLKLYVNGNLVSAVTKTGPMDLSSGNFYIGRFYPAPTHYFNGTIDEVKVWNYALSAEEISQIYESQKPAVSPTLSPFAGFWDSLSKFFNRIFDVSISNLFSLR